MDKVWASLIEWAYNVKYGKTLNPTEDELRGDWLTASSAGPAVRVRRAMILYASSRNPKRWNRLLRDYAWLEKTMREMGMNPKDARYLL